MITDKILKKELVSSKELAIKVGYSYDYISRLCRHGKVEGKKIGNVWFVNEASLRKFIAEQESLKSDRYEDLSKQRKTEYTTDNAEGQKRANVGSRKALALFASSAAAALTVMVLVWGTSNDAWRVKNFVPAVSLTPMLAQFEPAAVNFSSVSDRIGQAFSSAAVRVQHAFVALGQRLPFLPEVNAPIAYVDADTTALVDAPIVERSVGQLVALPTTALTTPSILSTAVLEINAATTISDTLDVSGATTLRDALRVSGTATFTRRLSALGGIVTGNADIDAGTGRIFASNVVNGITAGTNITITGTPQNPIISARAIVSGGSSSSGGAKIKSIELAVPSFLSVTGSPLTESGTLTIGLSGSALPVANGGTGSTTPYGILVGSTTQLTTLRIGTGLSFDGTTLTNTVVGGGAGTVTSVDASGGTTGLTFNGGPVTTSGTFTLEGTLGVANGGTGANSFAYGLILGNGTNNLTNIATSSLGLLTTHVAEGTNLYYTNARVNDVINASTTIAKLDRANIWTKLQQFQGNASTTALTVTGASWLSTARLSNTFTLSSILTCGGSRALQTNASGDVLCGSIAALGTSSAGGWTTDQIGNVYLSTSTDRVAIGATTTPYAKLVVESIAPATTTLALLPFTGQTANVIDIYNTSGSLSSVFTAAGRLGLGTTSPWRTLSVSGDSVITGKLSVAFASTTALSVSGTGYFGTASTTNAVISSIQSKLLVTNGTGTVQGYAGASCPGQLIQTINADGTVVCASPDGGGFVGILQVPNGGTGWGNIQAGALLYGNGTGNLATTTQGTGGQVLAWLNGIPTWTATTTLSTISGILDVAKGGTGQTSFTAGQLLYGNGTDDLSSVATTTFSFGSFPARLTGTLGSLVGGTDSSFTWWGLATTTNLVSGNLLYGSGANGVANVATSSLTFSGPFRGFASLGALVGGSNSTIVYTGLATTSQPTSSQLLVSNGGAGVYGVATTSVSCSGSVSCSTFSVLGSSPITITSSALTSNALATSTNETKGYLSYWTTTNGTPARLGSVATTTFSFGSFPARLTGTLGSLVGGTDSSFTWWGLATTTNLVSGNLLYGSGANGVANVATSTVSAGTGVTFTGTPGYLVGGSNLTINTPWTISGNNIFNNNAGKVGVGTSTPWGQLSASSTSAYPTLAVHQRGAGAAATFLGGNVGIGTTTPGTLLSLGSGTTAINFSNTATSTFSYGLNIRQGCYAISGVCLSAAGLGGLTSVTANYPILGNGTIGSPLSLAFGTTTNNTWSGVNTFSTLPVLGSLTGFVAANNGALYNVATSSIFGFTPVSNQLTKGYFIVGNDSGTAQATSSIFISSTGRIGIGTTTPGTILSLGNTGVNAINFSTTATSTFGYGLNIKNGCYAISGTCITAESLGVANYWTLSGNNIYNNNSGNVGIASSTPWGTLSINPVNQAVGVPSFVVGSSTKTDFIITQAGNVGIGTRTPSYPLSIVSSQNTGMSISLRPTNPAGGNKTAAYAGVFADPTGDSSTTYNGLVAEGYTALGNDNNFTGSFVGLYADAAVRGAGTKANAYGVFAEVYQSGSGLLTNAYGLATAINANASTITNAYGVYIGTAGGAGTITNDFGLYQVDAGSKNYFAGNVGLGTTTPRYKLTIATTTAPQLSLAAGTGIAQWTFRNAGGNLYVATTSTNGVSTSTVPALTILRTNSNVGIGIAAPTQKLDVAGNVNVSASSGYYQGGSRILFTDATHAATYVGVGAGNAAGTGAYDNSALGYQALFSNTSGINNTALGHSALYTNFNGSRNTAVGWYSLYANESGTDNVAIGNAALENASGSYNTALGGEALNAVTTGSNNIGIGYRAGYNNPITGSYNILIGNNIDLPNSDSFNMLSLGNLLYGTGLSTNAGTGVSTGKIGIGTTSPARKLTVLDSSAAQLMLTDGTSSPWNFRSINGNLYIATSSPTTLATTSIAAFTLDRRGNIGLGTTTPNGYSQGGRALSVVAPATGNTFAALELAGNTGTVGVKYGTISFINQENSAKTKGVLASISAIIGGNGTLFTDDSSLTFSTHQQGGSLTERLRITNIGNVGVGTTTPGSLFSIANVANFQTGTSTLYNNLNVRGQLKIGTGSIYLNGAATSTFSHGLSLAAGNIISSPGALTVNSGAASALTIDSGTTGALNLGTSANAKTITIGNVTGATAVNVNTGTGNFTINTNQLLVNKTTGYVGIGTSSPSAALTVNGNLLFVKEAARTISVGGSTSSNTAGGALSITAGAGNGTGTGGALSLVAGAAGASSATGGAVTITSGSSASSLSGAVNISSGSGLGSGAITISTPAALGTTGSISLTAGNSSFGTNAPGSITLTAGSQIASGNGANVTINAGDGVIDGNVLLNSGGIGNVGIATTTPWGKLSVTNTGAGPSFVVEDQTSPDSTPFIINADGNVGIGTASPSAQLTITGTGGATSGWIVRNSFDSVAGYFAGDTDNSIFYLTYAGTGVADFQLTSAGNVLLAPSSGLVGVGTSTPWGKLSVTNTGAGPSFVVEDATSPDSSPFLIDASGNVGIGDATPDDLLNVHSASAAAGIAITSLGTDTDAYLGFQLADGTNTFTIGVDDSDSDKFKISTTGLGTSDRLVIDSSGNVGIGNASPSYRLDVTGTLRTTSNLTVDGTTLTLTSAGFVNINNINSNSTVVVFAADANNDGSTEQFQFRIDDTIAGGARLAQIDTVGIYTDNMPAPGNSTVCRDASGASYFGSCTSLLKYKENIRDLPLGLDTVLALKPHLFDWRYNMGSPDDLGFIAEEVEAISPILTEYNDDGELTGVKYASMAALFARAIQQLDAREHLFASSTTIRLDSLESRLAMLENGLVSTTSSTSVTSLGASALTQLIAWLGDATNGIQDIYAAAFHAEEVHTRTLCVKKSDDTDICITGDELAALLAAQNISPAEPPSGEVIITDTPPPTVTPPDTSTSTPPVSDPVVPADNGSESGTTTTPDPTSDTPAEAPIDTSNAPEPAADTQADTPTEPALTATDTVATDTP